MSLPVTSGYNDINSDMQMAPSDRQKATDYLERFQVEFDETVTALYNDTFLMYLRLFSSENLDFVKSACRAEMKKKINYVVDISFTKH
ncbi:hypothetical protein DPMN_114383 [Dreissena polymorpha]|uniref:Uncharacterized protein n=1 Tax=Dreissena polymorpha TaxID=45954 RepID=A0A9D4KJW9_DREPO|nr:hypothetical protein DPMN_114383 [Dreissena polymorpha]